MKNIHLIPTNPNDETAKGIWIKETRDWCHIYITSDEEIKEGGYVFWESRVYKYRDFMEMKTLVYTDFFSIILTTDQDLIKDGVQVIPDEFLEWFVKNSTCDFVKINSESSRKHGMWKPECYPQIYKITIPKEEPKDVVLGYKTSLDAQMLDNWPFANKNPQVHKIGLEEPTMVDKLKDYLNRTPEEEIQKAWNETCKKTEGVDSPTVEEFLEVQRQLSKQETLEEAAGKWVFKTNGHNWSNNDNTAGDNYGSFMAGAKWQQERMYSEEEVYKKLHNLMTDIKLQGLVINDDIDLKKWFEENKKK